MTTAQLDHLRKIDAHCADLLDIGGASKDAEAGWKVTRTAIKSLLDISAYSNQFPTNIDGICPYGCDTPSIAEKALESILAAFPLEMLTP